MKSKFHITIKLKKEGMLMFMKNLQIKSRKVRRGFIVKCISTRSLISNLEEYRVYL